MAYQVVFRSDARKAFEQLDPTIQRQVGRVIDRLAENPRPTQATTLVGDPHTWRVRSGNWRVLYEIQDDRLIVLVLDVRHRSIAYRKRR